MTVPPNSVGLASFEEAHVAARQTTRKKMQKKKKKAKSEGSETSAVEPEGSAKMLPGAREQAELKLAHDRVEELEKVLAEKEKLLRKRRRELKRAKEEAEAERETSMREREAAEKLKVMSYVHRW